MIEKLYCEFKLARSNSRKDMVLRKAFGLYENAIRSKAVSLNKKFYIHDTEDFISIMQFGIFRGFNEKKHGEPLKKSIFRKMRSELSKFLQPFFSKKNSLWYEDFLPDNADYAEESSDCLDKIIFMEDMRRALQKLSDIAQHVISLWLEGNTIKTISSILKLARSTIYYHIEKSKKVLRESLGCYAT